MTTTYKCPKCGGSDYFMSQRNVVKGMGWAQRGSIKSIPVCRVCDEIMEGSQVGFKNWEDYGSGRASSVDSKLYSWWTRNSKLIFLLIAVALFDLFAAFIGNGTLSNVTGAIWWLLVIFSIIKWLKNRRKSKA